MFCDWLAGPVVRELRQTWSILTLPKLFINFSHIRVVHQVFILSVYNLIETFPEKWARGWFGIAICPQLRNRINTLLCNVFDSSFLTAGSFCGSFPITCLLNNICQRMCLLRIFFSRLQSHSRILAVALREPPASIHTSRLGIILIIRCKFCLHLYNTFGIELWKLYFNSSDLGIEETYLKLRAADCKLRNSTKRPTLGKW